MFFASKVKDIASDLLTIVKFGGWVLDKGAAVAGWFGGDDAAVAGMAHQAAGGGPYGFTSRTEIDMTVAAPRNVIKAIRTKTTGDTDQNIGVALKEQL